MARRYEASLAAKEHAKKMNAQKEKESQAQELGVDLAAVEQLHQLERRAITPDDYALLCNLKVRHLLSPHVHCY